MPRFEQESEFKERLVSVNRVSKTVKGGRNMRFSALVVVGDENGRVGAGMGKAAEIPEAIRKANEDAKKHLINVPIDGTTIPHEMTGYYSTAKSVLMPAPEGTGVIAGGAARAVLEMAGIRDIRTKSYGTNNPINMVKATIEALKKMRSAEQVAKMRGMVCRLLGYSRPIGRSFLLSASVMLRSGSSLTTGASSSSMVFSLCLLGISAHLLSRSA